MTKTDSSSAALTRPSTSIGVVIEMLGAVLSKVKVSVADVAELPAASSTFAVKVIVPSGKPEMSKSVISYKPVTASAVTVLSTLPAPPLDVATIVTVCPSAPSASPDTVIVSSSSAFATSSDVATAMVNVGAVLSKVIVV